VVQISVKDGEIVLDVLGWSQFFALKRQIRIPFNEIKGAERTAGAAKRWWNGWRIPGTHIPGVIVAGTYYRSGGREFWDVRRGNRALAINLKGGKYKRVVVDVEDPDATLAMVNEAIGGAA
jgi:hypothetical protein